MFCAVHICAEFDTGKVFSYSSAESVKFLWGFSDVSDFKRRAGEDDLWHHNYFEANPGPKFNLYKCEASSSNTLRMNFTVK